MFTESVTYPARGSNALSTLVIGGVLIILGFLLLPLIFVLGYGIRVARSVSNDESVPSDFDNWRPLFVDGLKLLGILLAYFFVPFMLIVIGWAAFWTVQGIPDVGLDPVLVRRILIAFGVVGFASFLLSGYVAPTGIVNFARTGLMSSAFAFRALWPVLKSGSYAVAWLLALCIMIAANVIIGVLAITVVGSLVGAFVYFYAAIISIHLYACGFRKVSPIEPVRNSKEGRPAS